MNPAADPRHLAGVTLHHARDAATEARRAHAEAVSLCVRLADARRRADAALADAEALRDALMRDA